MLQQTQVSVVIPYFEKWMQCFPDFLTLSHATESRVLKQWEGLGYYARARRLQLLAKNWTNAPVKPSTLAEWQTFPGIGPYTSAVICTLHFQGKQAGVDGNLVRVLSRLTANARVFPHTAHAVKAFQGLAQDLLEASCHPKIHTEAMMELGALVCTRSHPFCHLCPVASFCKGKHRANLYPAFERKKRHTKTIHRAFVRQSGKILLCHIHPTAKRLALLYELPLFSDLGKGVSEKTLLLEKTRTIANENIHEKIYAVSLHRHSKQQDALHWHTPEEIFQHLALSGPHKRWIKEILELP